MEQVVTIAGLCLTGAVMAALLKKNGPEQGLLLSAAVLMIGGGLLLESIKPVRETVAQMIAAGGLMPELFTPLLKTAGIALVSRVGSDLCRDAGESAMASLVEAAGSFGAILVSLPLLSAVWEMLQVMT